MRFHKKCTKILYRVSVFVYWFFDYYNTINDFIFIYLSHSLRHVSASNYCRRRVVLQLYKKKKWGRGLSFTGRTETDASPLQEELRQKPLLYRKNWDRSLSFTGRTETEASPLQLNYKLVILLLYQIITQLNVYQ